jgi:hypothetical protein
MRPPADEPHIAAHAFSSHQRGSVMKSNLCGCFYCLELFLPTEICEWTDAGDTAMCPKCGIDSVIASEAGYPLTREFLGRMQEHWFWSH